MAWAWAERMLNPPPGTHTNAISPLDCRSMANFRHKATVLISGHMPGDPAIDRFGSKRSLRRRCSERQSWFDEQNRSRGRRLLP